MSNSQGQTLPSGLSGTESDTPQLQSVERSNGVAWKIAVSMPGRDQNSGLEKLRLKTLRG